MAEAVTIELMPGWRQEDGSHIAGLRVSLEPGWKTYWRSAGSAGISPRMDWRGSRNVRSVTPLWPTPSVFGPPGALSIGYETDFVLPLLIQTDSRGPVQLSGQLDIGVCAEICVPASLRLAGELPAVGAPSVDLRDALSDRPQNVTANVTCRLGATEDGLRLTAETRLPSQGGQEAVVFEIPDPSIWIADAVVTREGDRLSAASDLLAGGGPMSVDRGEVRITVIGQDGAVELQGCTG